MYQLRNSEPASAAPADADLVGRIRAGDAAAFETVIRRYNRRLFRIARGILGNDAAAEDVVQETYVRAYARLDALGRPALLASWLAKIATNEALGRLRRRGRVVSLEDYLDGTGKGQAPMDAFDSPLPDPERSAASAEMRRVLEAAIDSLPQAFRGVFVMRAVEQMSVAETAECLGIPVETVRTRFHRARLMMQAAIDSRVAAQTGAVFPFAGERCDRVVATVFARLGIAGGN